MTDREESQPTLGQFGGDEEESRRPHAAEAEAVAGGSTGESTAAVVDPDAERYPDADGDIELAVTQVDYTIEGSQRDERPIIHLFGRTRANEPEHVRVHEFRPYFYAPTDSLEPGALDRSEITGSTDTDSDGEPFESIRGEQLTRIYGRTPRDVGAIREEFEHFEADILFPNRFLIDKDVRSGVRLPERRAEDGALDVRHDEVLPTDLSVDLRVDTFDIEVDDRHGFPEEGEQPILCLASHDSYDEEYIAWHFDAPAAEVSPPGALDDHELLEDAALDVRTFDTEEAMLAAFLDYIEETNPDVLTGWNFDDFDAPYLIDRLDRLDAGTEHDLDYNRLSRVEEVWRSDWQGPDIKGRVVFDLLYAYQQTQFSELDSYRLDAVGEVELDVGKERYAGDIGDLWEQDPQRLLEYNVRDVELCVEIDRKQDIVEFWEEVSSFVGCKLEDATTAGDVVDMYVLHTVHGEFVLPSKGTVESEEFEGGAVFEPITGVRENVTVLDLKSLYPMCMVTTNASPETKVDPTEYDGETYQAPNGTSFRKQPDGIIREMVDELLSEREQKKQLRDQHEPSSPDYQRLDNQQGAVKVIMNCFTPDTDVLTPAGVRNIRELAVGDDVYSLDPDTMELEVKPVVETQAYPAYRGELIDIETPNTDLRVTPNHRMLVRKTEPDGTTDAEYSFVEAGALERETNYELPHDWSMDHGTPLETVDLSRLVDGEYELWVRPSVDDHTFTTELGWQPRRLSMAEGGDGGYVFTSAEFEADREYIDSVAERCFLKRHSGHTWVPRTYDGEDVLDLLAWYLTAGSVSTPEEQTGPENPRGSAPTVTIAQNAQAVADGGSDHAAIGALLDRMGFDWDVEDRSYQVPSRLLGAALESVCGGNRVEKRIPALVWELDESQKRRFLDTLIAGGGDRQANSWCYTTPSEQLRDDVLKLCAHLGLSPTYSREGGSWRIHATDGATNTLRMDRSATQSSAEDGVYCATVADNHTLLAGRNGTFQFVGQSLYGVLGWDRFRLYDKEMGAAVTATGREAIEFTESAADDLGHDVVYGDTDSVMLELGPDVERAEALEESEAIESHINDAYDRFATEELNADAHRFEIEFEKLYRRFFQAGAKKRYAGHIVWKEGKDVDDIDITGFEYKRSDIAPITKEVQREVIEMIVTGEDLEDIKEYLHNVIEDVKSGDVSLEAIGIPGGIGKRLDNYETDTAHVRGAKYANMLFETNFDKGSKPKRLYLKKVHPGYVSRVESEQDLANSDRFDAFKRDPDVVCFEYPDQIPDEFEVDWEKMLEKTLEGPISRVIEALGISWAEVKSGQTQTGLGNFG